jgi:NAD(P)-dependent dehydrogenase (short-subunit alcohol dehydrogenase family)
MSKAALNMGSRILAAEWAERFPGAGVITVHPGLMDTPMQQPFRQEIDPALLQDPALPLQTVGERLGFARQSSFTRFFREEFALSPREFRSRRSRL